MFTKSATGLSWVWWLRSIPPNPDTLWFFLILSACLRIGFISTIFPSGTRTKYFERNTNPYHTCYIPHTYYHLFVYPNVVEEGVGLRPLVCWDCEFELRRRHGCLSLVSVVCCQVELCATSWSLVQRSPTDCGVSERDLEISRMRGPWLALGQSSYVNLYFPEKREVAWNEQLRTPALNQEVQDGSVFLTFVSELKFDSRWWYHWCPSYICDDFIYGMQLFLSVSCYPRIPSRQKFLLLKTDVVGLWLIALRAPRSCVFRNQHMHRVILDPQPLRDLCKEWCYHFKPLTWQFVLVHKNGA